MMGSDILMNIPSPYPYHTFSPRYGVESHTLVLPNDRSQSNQEILPLPPVRRFRYCRRTSRHARLLLITKCYQLRKINVTFSVRRHDHVMFVDGVEQLFHFSVAGVMPKHNA